MSFQKLSILQFNQVLNFFVCFWGFLFLFLEGEDFKALHM